MRIVKAITAIAIAGGLLFEGTRAVAGSNEFGKTLHEYTLDIKARKLGGAAISPDSRFVAVYAVNSEDLPGTRADEFVYEIQIWNWRESKIVARKVLSRERPVDFRKSSPHEAFVRYADTGSKLIVGQEGHVLVLNSTTLDQLQDIDLEMANWPAWRKGGGAQYSWGSYEAFGVADVEVDSSAMRGAVLLNWGKGFGGQLRAYDLASGRLLRKWDFPGGTGPGGENSVRFLSHRPIAIDPNGKKIAISMERFTPDHQRVTSEPNVLILDVDSSLTIATINTGYLAGPVRFAPGDPLTLLTVKADKTRDSKRDPMELSAEFPKNSEQDPIMVWNAVTGALIREIHSPPGGVHSHLEVSADGRVALGYTGYEKCGFFWLGLESGCSPMNNRFRLWDLTTGKVIATSPDLFESESGHTGLNFHSGPDQLHLSPKGDVVLIDSQSLVLTHKPLRSKQDVVLIYNESLGLVRTPLRFYRLE